MEVESFLDLFDSCWFSLEILTQTHSQNQIPELPFDNQKSEPKFSSLRSILIRSKSEELSSEANFNYGSPSPSFPHLKSIPSDKELPAEKTQKANAFAVEEKRLVEDTEGLLGEMRKPRQSSRVGGGRRRNRGSKSLSELEFEELKGFMDLGFVFSEEDKDSSLVQIIPGLQRLGQNEENGGSAQDQETGESSTASRAPYLSEAWEVLLMEEERRRKKRENSKILKNWRVPVPALTSEIDMKDNLRSWAHTIASAVR